jgi:osmotically inducible protein OsmC
VFKEKQMGDIRRMAEATWEGSLRAGEGMISTESLALSEAPFSFRTRFGGASGTNPEELIAAAHAGCYSMAFAHTLSENGHTPEYVTTKATCTLASENGGHRIAGMHLQVKGRVSGLGKEDFERLAQEATERCLVSKMLRTGIEVGMEVTLE